MSSETRTERRDQEQQDTQGGFRHTVAVTAGESFAVQVQAGQFAWTLDEPETVGGEGAAPDPVTAFLGALCGCLLISLRITARTRQVPISRAEASARANEKGSVKTVEVQLAVHSAAPEETVRAVVERAERGCYIRALLKESLHYRLDVSILPVP